MNPTLIEDRMQFLQLLVAAAEASQSGLTIARREPGSTPLIYVNSGFCSMSGYSPAQVLGRDCRFLQGEGTDPEELERVRKAIRGCQPITSRLLNYRADGTAFWNELILAPIVDDDGVVRHYAGIQRDVSREVAYEGRLTENNSDLTEQAERLEQSNQKLFNFASAISHDLRGPLGVMGSLAEGLRTLVKEGRTAEALSLLETLAGTAGRLKDLVEGLFSLGKAGGSSLVSRRVDIARLAREAAAEMAVIHPGRVVQFEVEDGLVAFGDETLLRSAIQNLMSNAWKYTAQVPEARIQVGRQGPGEFFIQDNGAGFDMSAASGLFEPFARLHAPEQFEGTGLGLATVRQIVERHGGRIVARSEPGKGARFTFGLPARPLHEAGTATAVEQAS